MKLAVDCMTWDVALNQFCQAHLVMLHEILYSPDPNAFGSTHSARAKCSFCKAQTRPDAMIYMVLKVYVSIECSQVMGMKVLLLILLISSALHGSHAGGQKKKQVSWSSDDCKRDSAPEDDQPKPKSPAKKKIRQRDEVEDLTSAMNGLTVTGNSSSSSSSSSQWQASDWNAGWQASGWQSNNWYTGCWWKCQHCDDWHFCQGWCIISNHCT